MNTYQNNIWKYLFWSHTPEASKSKDFGAFSFSKVLKFGKTVSLKLSKDDGAVF